MKNFALVAVLTSILVFGFSMYYEFSIVPKSESAAKTLDELNTQILTLEMEQPNNPELDSIRDKRNEFYASRDAKVDVGNILILIAGISLIMAVIPAIKKQKIAWLGVGLSLVALVIGLARATHMFS